MGTIIDPSEIKKQTQSIVTALSAQTDVLANILPSIESFENSSGLQSEAWDALKSKIGGHRILITSLINTHDIVKADSETLINSVGSEKLDEDKINESINEIKMNRQRSSQMISMYQTLESSLPTETIPSLALHYTTQISSLLASIQYNNLAIVKLQRKLEKIDQIRASTESLYESVDAYYSFIQIGINDLVTGWNSAGKPIGIKNAWYSILEDPIEMEKASNLLKEGLTRDDLIFMKNAGYSMDELSNIWNRIKENKKDKLFFEALIKREYGRYINVFRFNIEDLSDDMKLIMTNHLAKMTKFKDDDGKLSELTMIINALLYTDYRDRADSYLLTMASLSEAMAIQTASLMSEIDSSSSSYLQASELYDGFRNLYNLSMGVSVLDTSTNAKNDILFHAEWWNGIDNLSINSNGKTTFELYSYTLSSIKSSNWSKIYNGQIPEKGKVHYLGSSISSQNNLRTGSIAESGGAMTKLEEKKSQVIMDTTMNIIASTSGIFNPLFKFNKFNVDIVKNAENGNFNEIANGVINKATEVSSKTGFIGNLSSVGNEMFKYQREMNEIDKELSQKMKNVYNGIVNVGVAHSSYRHSNNNESTYSFSGLPNEKSIRSLKEIEKNGIKNMLTLNQKNSLIEQFGGKDTLSDSEKYLLGESEKSLTELDPNEFINTFINLEIEGEPDFSSESVLSWLERGEYHQ